uniref:hypothetical protein n=1 Tax=Gemmiger formicilis TaxID=745368 RepID=UPI004028116C
MHRPAGFAANASVPGRYGIRPYGITHSKPFLTVSPLFFDHAARNVQGFVDGDLVAQLGQIAR